MSEMPRCSVCGAKVKALPEYKYCGCEFCEGHQVKGWVMGCEHQGSIDVPDMMRQINTFRSGTLDMLMKKAKERENG